MGLLKNLLDIAGKVASVAQEYAAKQEAETKKAPSYDYEAPVPERTAAEWRAYFREIIKEEFSDYDVRENVPVTDLAGNTSDEFKLYKTRPTQAYKAEWGQPYSFVLESGGSAKGVVMLGNGHSHDSNVKYLIARMYAKKLGIPYINFYTQMPNDRNYVIGRIRKLMG